MIDTIILIKLQLVVVLMYFDDYSYKLIDQSDRNCFYVNEIVLVSLVLLY